MALGDDMVRKAYGDRLFQLGNVIARTHEVDALNPLSSQEVLENSGMESVRILI